LKTKNLLLKFDSFGRLFSLAIIGASDDVAGSSQEESAGRGFTFDEPDLLADFFSYAALTYWDHDRTALLDADKFIEAAQSVYNTFFLAFISNPNNYDGYWAYQPVNAMLPADLNFASESVTTSYSTYTTTEYAASNTSTTTYTGTGEWRSTSWIPFPATTPSSSSLSKRQAPTSTTKPAIYEFPTSLPSTTTVPVTMHIRAQVLQVSTTAIWSSFALLVFLSIMTVFIAFKQRKYVKILPHGVETPAELLALVHASTELRSWAHRHHEHQQSLAHPSSLWERVMPRAKLHAEEYHDDTLIGLGAFGENHWGVEVGAKTLDQTTDHQPHWEKQHQDTGLKTNTITYTTVAQCE
jgi:hypothetical protein